MKKRDLLSLVLALVLALSFCVPAYAAGTEAGEKALTRGEVVVGLFTQTGTMSDGKQETFTDVPAEGALAQAVGWAVEQGVVNGYGDRRFGPDDPVTREQMAAMLYRSAGALGQAPQGAWSFPLGYTDAGEISDYAVKAMQWAVMNRILNGIGGALEPGAYATEGQLSAVLDRWEDFLRERGILILFTSDVHCGVDQGFGYAGLQEVRDALVAQGYDVILVDDGDSIQGETIGTMTKGTAIVELMDMMGYSVAIPGNHEFDYGMENFLTLAETASFDYVSCNFVYKGEAVFKPYVIRTVGGKRIAFIGVTTPKTLTSSTPAHFKDESGEFVYGFLQDGTGEGVYGAVQQAADAAHGEGADYVVVLAHLGNGAVFAPYTYGDVISHTRGIDALLDGHSHDTDQVRVKNKDGKEIPRSGCGTKLAAVGWCRITADGAVSTGLYTWNDSVAAPEKLGLDNYMASAVAAASAELNAKLDEVVARTEVALTINDPVAVDANGKPIRMIRRAETNLGDLCADAYRAQSGADVAFVNGGGIRTSIPAGDVTLGDILSVHPFGNALCVVEATGQMILDALEWGARAVPGETGGFQQVSGLTYEIDSSVASPCVADENGLFVRVEGARRVKNVLVGGEPIDPEKTYTLASHNYMLLENGDGVTAFDGAPLLLDCVKLDNQVLIDYITETLGGVIGEEYADPYGQGRIVIS